MVVAAVVVAADVENVGRVCVDERAVGLSPRRGLSAGGFEPAAPPPEAARDELRLHLALRRALHVRPRESAVLYAEKLRVGNLREDVEPRPCVILLYAPALRVRRVELFQKFRGAHGARAIRGGFARLLVEEVFERRAAELLRARLRQRIDTAAPVEQPFARERRDRIHVGPLGFEHLPVPARIKRVEKRYKHHVVRHDAPPLRLYIKFCVAG